MGQRKVKSAPIFFWNRRHMMQAQNFGVANVQSIGAPFYYARRNLFPDGTWDTSDRAGTFVLPSHSGEGIRRTYALRRMIEFVGRNYPPPFTVSIYYQDLATTDFSAYRDAGWRVVSSGTRMDPMFMYRSIAEMSRHSAFVADGPQTGLWYAAALGLQVSTVDPQEWGATNLWNYSADTRWPQLASGIGGAAAQDLAAEELGREFVLEPDQLMGTLGWDSPIKRSAAWALSKVSDVRHGKSIRQGNITSRNLAHLKKRASQ
jgi:hypothetical protein